MKRFDKIRTVLCLCAGALTAVLALSPGIDARADASFAWHMAQHLMLLFVVSFFIVAAEPFPVFVDLAPRSAVAAVVRFSRLIEGVTRPAVALPVFVAVLWGTHFSMLYNYALDHELAHAGEHVLYLAAGMLFWMPVLAPPPLRPIPFPARILYLVVALPQGALLAFALGSSRRVLYSHYAVYPNALVDQSNGAALMWIVGGLIVFCAFIGTFAAWAVREGSASGEPFAEGTL